MSSETAINMIETVKKKLEKYFDLKEPNKVKEYLHKLQHTSVTPLLLQETQMDELVRRLASDTDASYSSTAESLLKKWQNKKQPTKSSATKKIPASTGSNKTVTEKKLGVKRKSEDDVTHSNGTSESQSSDDHKNDMASSSFSLPKKRKVLSLAQYAESKRGSTSSSTIISTQNTLTDSQIEEINAQFNATTEKLAANAPDLATVVNKNLTRTEKNTHNRPESIASSSSNRSPKTMTGQQQTKTGSLWDDDDDDDDEEEAVEINHKHKKTVNSDSGVSVQQVKQSTAASIPVKTTTKANDQSPPSVTIAKTLPQQSRPPIPPAPKKAVDILSFLPSKRERQAIYSGKRTTRNHVPALEDLCIEVLKDRVDMMCHKHFHLLPYKVIKPVIELATPEQLLEIMNNNPIYADDVEPLWKHFCSLHFKDAERQECESYFELYCRQVNEKEDRLQQITEHAKRKKAQATDSTRQTKTLHFRQNNSKQTNGRLPNNHKGTGHTSLRLAAGVPPPLPPNGRSKVKKPVIPPLLKKTLKLHKG